MSNYQRLISYIYTYEGGIKGKNTGFTKLEERNGQCRLTVSVKKIFAGGNPMGVYLLAGDGEIRIGTMFVRNGSGEFRAVLNARDVEGSGRTLEECRGLTVHDVENPWRAYTTIWEDAVARAAEVELAQVTSENVRKKQKEEGIKDPPGVSLPISSEIERELEREEGKKESGQGELGKNEIPREKKTGDGEKGGAEEGGETVQTAWGQPEKAKEYGKAGGGGGDGTDMETEERRSLGEPDRLTGAGTGESGETAAGEKNAEERAAARSLLKRSARSLIGRTGPVFSQPGDGFLKKPSYARQAGAPPAYESMEGASGIPERMRSSGGGDIQGNLSKCVREYVMGAAKSEEGKGKDSPEGTKRPEIILEKSGTGGKRQRETAGAPGREQGASAALGFVLERETEEAALPPAQNMPGQPEPGPGETEPAGETEPGRAGAQEGTAAAQSLAAELTVPGENAYSEQYSIRRGRYDRREGREGKEGREERENGEIQAGAERKRENSEPGDLRRGVRARLIGRSVPPPQAGGETLQKAETADRAGAADRADRTAGPRREQPRSRRQTPESMSAREWAERMEGVKAKDPMSRELLSALAPAGSARTEELPPSDTEYAGYGEGNSRGFAAFDADDPEQCSHQRMWARLRRKYPKILAFDYDDGCEILTIKPQDIGLLPRETWVFGNNSFLLHGYYSYRYLILARLENPDGEPRYLLGVPGRYHPNEKYMASMFGFPDFVLSKRQPSGDGSFGYWYTDIRVGE